MSTFVKTFRKNNTKQFTKYKKYIDENDWSKPVIKRDGEGRIIHSKYYYIKDVKDKGEVIYEGKETEFKLQQKLAESVLDRLKYFVKSAEGDIGKNQTADRAVKQMRLILEAHLKRIDGYISSFSVLEDKEVAKEEEGKTQKEYKSEEIQFDDLLYKAQTKINDEIKKLNLERENEDSILELLDNQKAPLSMREKIENDFPDVRRKVKAMNLNFDSPPKNEMFIHIENPPEWNEDKHYFEQDKKTLQFYIDEYKKIKRGITIDGVYITPWMYCHLNVFKTDIPTPFLNKHTNKIESEDKIMNPPLRDNEWFIIQDSYEDAKERGEMLFLCATRRAAKTTLIASHLFQVGLSGGKELVVAGGSAKDLGQIEKNFQKTVQNAHPAFKLPNISNDWSKKVKLGVKKKNQQDVLQCVLNVVNLNSGGEKSSEILAGFTPDAFVLDECMKSPFLDQLNAAKPAFDSPYGKRLVPLLSGTGSSNDALTKDAFQILSSPKSEGVCTMNWNALERNIPEEYITWKRRNFGTFLPAQMSAKDGMVKLERTLSEYLNVLPTEKLDKIKINVTDWKKSIDIIKADRKKLQGNKKSLTKEIVYYPIDPEEIFLSGKPNPFPREELKRYKQRLIESGDIGKNVVLDYDNDGNVVYELSDKELAPYPYNGGFHDAPVTIFEDPLPNAPFEFAVAGCLVPGEKVLTDKGEKNVEEVTLDDKLINKDGEYVDIINLQRREKKDENIYSIRVGGNCRYTTFTKEHPIYVSRPDYYTTEKSKGRIKKYNFGKEDFVKAKDLEKGDWIKFPNVYYDKKNDFDICELWDKYSPRIDKDINCPLYNEDFWLFIGTFLGDGWTGGKHTVHIVFNDKEKLHSDNCIKFIKNVLGRSVNITRKKSRNCFEVSFSCKQMHDFLEDNFSKYASNKNIPEWVKKIDDNYKYNLICGYLNSDGCTLNHPLGHIYSKFVSISHKLLEDTQDILFSLGIVSSITKLRDESVHYFPNGYTSKTQKTYQLSIAQEGSLKLHENLRENISLKIPKLLKKNLKYRKGKETFISEDNKYIFYKVINIKKQTYTGTVYNFECETNTFLTKNITTHNCDDYKQEQADSDSVGSFCVVRRDTGNVVATYHSRPDPHSKFHRQALLLLEKYKAPVFMENEDMGFKEYTDRMEVTDEYILKAINFLGDMSLDSNGRRAYGWTPTGKNKSYLLGIFINTMKKQEDYEDDNGRIRTKFGFEKIKDLRIIDEMINFREGGNFDAITAAMSAYAYDYYLTTVYGAPEKPLTEEEKRQLQERREKYKNRNKTRSLFPKQRKNLFPTTGRRGLF